MNAGNLEGLRESLKNTLRAINRAIVDDPSNTVGNGMFARVNPNIMRQTLLDAIDLGDEVVARQQMTQILGAKHQLPFELVELAKSEFLWYLASISPNGRMIPLNKLTAGCLPAFGDDTHERNVLLTPQWEKPTSLITATSGYKDGEHYFGWTGKFYSLKELEGSWFFPLSLLLVRP